MATKTDREKLLAFAAELEEAATWIRVALDEERSYLGRDEARRLLAREIDGYGKLAFAHAVRDWHEYDEEV